jgi:broad specificity phosphatase PhoE
LRTLVLVRHAHARTNAEDAVSSTPPGTGLTEQGVGEALALREALAGTEIHLGVATRLVRTQETLALALGERDVARIVLPGLDEIGFGAFEGGSLSAYRAWAWSHAPAAPCPGGGESRADAAVRYADALDRLLARPEDVVLAVSHALAVRYVLDAADGAFPAAQVSPVGHAEPNALAAADVERAAATLRAWAQAPVFVDAPGRG